MTNLEYYGFEHLEFKDYFVYGSDTEGLAEIWYVTRHSKDDILLYSTLGIVDDVREAKIKWLLEEYNTDNAYRTGRGINGYKMKHANTRRQKC